MNHGLCSIKNHHFAPWHVAPMQIREQGCVYKMLKIEQAGEVLHKTLNALDLQFGNEKDKSKRYFQMLRELENLYYEPCSETLQTCILNHMLADTETTFKKVLHQCNSIDANTDSRTSNSQESFISMIGHVIDNK